MEEAKFFGYNYQKIGKTDESTNFPGDKKPGTEAVPGIGSVAQAEPHPLLCPM